MKVPFYILGLLIRYGPQSGYSLKQIIECDISDFAKIKLPTIYYHLDKLKEKDYVIVSTDKDGNRPEKQIYTITESGKKHFEKIFLKQLEENHLFEFALDGAFYFNDMISQEILLESLINKRLMIQSQLESLKIHKVNTLKNINKHAKYSAKAIFNHHIIHLEAELSWLDETIMGLKK